MIGDSANSVEEVYPYATTAGVPAEVKKYRFDNATIKKLLEKQWWNGSEDEIKSVKEHEFRVGEYVG